MTHTTTRRAFRLTGIPQNAAGIAEISEVLAATDETDVRGMPIYRNTAMAAAIDHRGDRVVPANRVIITDWPGHSWDEVTAVTLSATAVD